MKEITKTEAHELIRKDEAGYYAVSANPPIPHDDQMVVFTQGKWYLCTTKEIKLEKMGVVTLKSPVDGGPLPKMTWGVVIDDESELCALLQKDIEASQDVDVGAGVKSKYTGHPGRPETRN